jgi:hypothetical protein
VALVTGGRADFALVASAERFGPALSIGIVEQNTSTFRWSITVGVRVSEADYVLGHVLTIPPFAPVLQQPAPAPIPTRLVGTRIVAIAFCPGVQTWKISLLASQTDPSPGAPSIEEASCEVTLQAQHFPGSRPGVYRTDPDGTVSDGQVTAAISTAQIIVGAAAPTLLLPDDPNRRRGEVRNLGPLDLFIGDAFVTSASGFPLFAATLDRFVTDSQRPLFGIASAAPNTLVARFIHHG